MQAARTLAMAMQGVGSGIGGKVKVKISHGLPTALPWSQYLEIQHSFCFSNCELLRLGLAFRVLAIICASSLEW
jgi:hypothetical protein